MLYTILKLPARLAFFIFCRHWQTNDKSCFSLPGPLLIAANHPNSFLDAIVFSVLFKRPVYSLARGDVFVNKTIGSILKNLNILPVFRLSEGADRLDENYGTFGRCREIFRQNGIVLIFSEGLCVNEWHLRELKKGTARLAISAWEEGIPVKILPAGINYQSFSSFGKNIILRFGKLMSASDITDNDSFGKTIQSFNLQLKSELSHLVIEADKNDTQKLHDIFHVKISPVKRFLLFLPAVTGYILHAPLYFPLKSYIRKKAGHTGHYDSIITASLFLLYPFYLLTAALISGLFLENAWALSVFVLMPFSAYCCIRLKKQF